MTFKFCVGDVVVNFEGLQFWDNPYHFNLVQSTLRKEVVLAADEKYFTTSPHINLQRFNGLSSYDDQRLVCYQPNGYSVEGTKKYVNWTKNETNIRAYLKGLQDGALLNCERLDNDEIAKLEAEIRHRQACIDAIKNGKRPISYKRDLVERDFIAERMNAVLALLEK